MTDILERIRNPRPQNWARVVYVIMLTLMVTSSVAVIVLAARGEWIRVELASLKGMVAWVLMEIYAAKAALIDAARDG